MWPRYVKDHDREEKGQNRLERRRAPRRTVRVHPRAMLARTESCVPPGEVLREPVRGELHRWSWKDATERDAPAGWATGSARLFEPGDRERDCGQWKRQRGRRRERN